MGSPYAVRVSIRERPKLQGDVERVVQTHSGVTSTDIVIIRLSQSFHGGVSSDDAPGKIRVQMHREVVNGRLARSRKIFRPRAHLRIEQRRDIPNRD